MTQTYRIFANDKDTGLTVSNEKQALKVSVPNIDAYHESDVLSFTLSDVREGIYENITIDDQQMIINCKIEVKERVFKEMPQFVFNTFIKDFNQVSERANFYLQAGNKILNLNDSGEFVFVGNDMALDWQIRYKGKYHWDYIYKNHVIIVTDKLDQEQIRIMRIDRHDHAEHLCDDAFALRFTISNCKYIDSRVVVYLHTDQGKTPYTLFFMPSTVRKEQYEALLILPEEYCNVEVNGLSFSSAKYDYKTIHLKGKLKKYVTIPIDVKGRKNPLSSGIGIRPLVYGIFILLLGTILCLAFSAIKIDGLKKDNIYWRGLYEGECRKVGDFNNITDTLVQALGTTTQEWNGMKDVKVVKGYKKVFYDLNLSALMGDTVEFDYRNSCSSPGVFNAQFLVNGETFNIWSKNERGHSLFVIPKAGVYNVVFSYRTDTCNTHSISVENLRLKRNNDFIQHFRTPSSK